MSVISRRASIVIRCIASVIKLLLCLYNDSTFSHFSQFHHLSSLRYITPTEKNISCGLHALDWFDLFHLIFTFFLILTSCMDAAALVNSNVRFFHIDILLSLGLWLLSFREAQLRHRKSSWSRHDCCRHEMLRLSLQETRYSKLVIATIKHLPVSGHRHTVGEERLRRTPPYDGPPRFWETQHCFSKID